MSKLVVITTSLFMLDACDFERFLHFATGQCEYEDADTKRYLTCPLTHTSILPRACAREASEHQLHSALHSAEQGPSDPLPLPCYCLPGSYFEEPSTGCSGKEDITRASAMTQDQSPILLLRGSSSSKLAREEGGMGGLFPSPRASCVEVGLHRALFTAQRTYKD